TPPSQQSTVPVTSCLGTRLSRLRNSRDYSTEPEILMPYRALIIGIENYAAVEDGSLAKSLPGTVKSAGDFKDWLSAKWRAEGVGETDTQMIICSEPALSGGRPATTKSILSAILELKRDGQGATDEFFFFFSGRGFSFVDNGFRADMLVA